jgi:hypothetical protein
MLQSENGVVVAKIVHIGSAVATITKRGPCMDDSRAASTSSRVSRGPRPPLRPISSTPWTLHYRRTRPGASSEYATPPLLFTLTSKSPATRLPTVCSSQRALSATVSARAATTPLPPVQDSSFRQSFEIRAALIPSSGPVPAFPTLNPPHRLYPDSLALPR